MNDKPTIVIPFGATGDLMRIKVLPALFELFARGSLPKKFRVIGFSHRAMDTEGFRAHVRGMTDGDDAFLDLFEFQRGEFEEEAAYKNLTQTVVAIEREWGTSANKLFYFSVSPRFYADIAAKLKNVGLNDAHGDAWTRVIIEKPFGTDGKSAEILEEALAQVFTESQIYRIDHYLAKDAVDEILTLRNRVKLDKNSVTSIRIELLEEIGVEKRGAFYDPLGALRDVGQNHILEILAFLTMEEPQGGNVCRARADVLGSLPILNTNDIATRTFRAQHEGYQAIPSVNPNSKTETYYKIALVLTAPRWQGVPVIMESGKCMGKAHKLITLTMRMGEEIKISLESKSKYTGEYAKLLRYALLGEYTRFIGREEVAAMWRFVDPIEAAWHSGIPPLRTYVPDTRDIVEESKIVENGLV